jgi:hypothetical protein
MTFIISEDEALRNMLTGMTVSDNKNPTRPVGVWFGQPDPEIRAQSFPFITVDLIDISEARERVMAGRGEAWYLTPEDLEPDEGWDMFLPVPINLDYQVTTFARQPRHDRQILAQLMANRLPLRFGSLPVVEYVTEEQEGGKTIEVGQATVRRLDVLNVLKRDITESGKRMFMNVFTVRVSSEIPQPYDFATYKKAAEIRITTSTYQPNSRFPRLPYEVIEVSVGSQSGTP